MKLRRRLSQFTAAALCLALLLSPTAQALTPGQALVLLKLYYVDELPQAIYEQTTISGMLNTLGDPYTEYLSAEEYSYFMGTMSDTKLVGIGIVYSTGEDGLVLSDVLDGSPAQAGGLQAGDVIVQVDDHSAKGITAAEAASWIQGEEGTKVRITYLRGKNRTTVSLPRAVVTIPATTAELIDGHIGYISCTTFGEETVGHFQDAIATYGDQATCWIVDLRDNTGGITVAATESAGLFAGPGEIAYFRDGAGAYSAFQHDEEIATILPVIVLTNEKTASASEIFAAAIQGSESGIVIGSRSFGKGVAQTIFDQDVIPTYFPDGDAFKITTDRFFSTLGNTTDQVGVLPNVMAPPEAALDLAWMLAGSADGSRTDQALRIDLGYGHSWRWFVDLDVAASEEYLPLFAYLLNSLPPGTDLWLRETKDDEWEPVRVEEVCDAYGLSYDSYAFSDAESSEHPDVLSLLRYYGLLNGREDGAYYPQDTLTRAELCHLLAGALNCDYPHNSSPFIDVDDGAWYAPAVTAISNMGLVNGVGDGLFLPEEPVDHQQFLTVMGRLAQWMNMFFHMKANEMPDGAVEDESLAGYDLWARPYVWLLTQSRKNIFGMPVSLAWDAAGNISATGATTRDEAAVTLYNILSSAGVLPN